MGKRKLQNSQDTFLDDIPLNVSIEKPEEKRKSIRLKNLSQNESDGSQSLGEKPSPAQKKAKTTAKNAKNSTKKSKEEEKEEETEDKSTKNGNTNKKTPKSKSEAKKTPKRTQKSPKKSSKSDSFDLSEEENQEKSLESEGEEKETKKTPSKSAKKGKKSKKKEEESEEEEEVEEEIVEKKKGNSPKKNSKSPSKRAKNSKKEEEEVDLAADAAKWAAMKKEKKKSTKSVSLLSLVEGLEEEEEEKTEEKEEEKEENEKQWDAKKSSKKIQILSTKIKRKTLNLKAKCADVKGGTVQTEAAFSLDDGNISYFEVKLEGKEEGLKFEEKEEEKKEGKMEDDRQWIIGLSPIAPNFDVMIGKAKNSLGLSNNGKVYSGNGKEDGRQYSTHFEEDSIVGCGFFHNSGRIFFTLNGKFLGMAGRSDPASTLYPSLSLKGGAVASLNYGQLPFQFDLSVESIRGESKYDTNRLMGEKVANQILTSPAIARNTPNRFTPKKSPGESAFLSPLRSPVSPVISSKSPSSEYWEKEAIFLSERLKSDVKCGLFHEESGIPLPLTAVQVKVQALDSFGQITVSQTFANNKNVETDALYYFPVDASSLIKFQIENRRRIFTSKVERIKKEGDLEESDDEEEESKEIPKSTLTSENGPTLCAKINGIGKSDKNRFIKISVTYAVKLLDNGRDGLTLALPSFVFPSVASRWNTDVFTPDGSVFEVGSPELELDISFKLNGRIKAITSSTHQQEMRERVTFQNSARTARVQFQTRSLGPYLFQMIKEENDNIQAFAEVEEDEEIVCGVSVRPRHFVSNKSHGFIVAFDSRNSDKKKAVVDATRMILKGLPSNSPFQLVSLSDDGFELWESDREFSLYDNRTLSSAEEFLNGKAKEGKKVEIEAISLDSFVKHLTGLKFDEEGTLKKNNKGIRFDVLLVLGGDIQELDSTLAQDEAFENQSLRIFALGLGITDSFSQESFKNFAKAGCGIGNIVNSPSQVKEQVNRMLQGVMTSSMSLPSLKWGGIEQTLKFQQVPSKLPTLVFQGESMEAFCRAKGDLPEDCKVTIIENGKQVEKKIEVVAKGIKVLRHFYRILSLLDMPTSVNDENSQAVRDNLGIVAGEAAKYQILFNPVLDRLKIVMREKLKSDDKGATKKVGSFQVWFENCGPNLEGGKEEEGVKNLFESGKLQETFEDYESGILDRLFALQRAKGHWSFHDEELYEVLKMDKKAVDFLLTQKFMNGDIVYQEACATYLALDFCQFMKFPEEDYFFLREKSKQWYEQEMKKLPKTRIAFGYIARNTKWLKKLEE
eukprot:TRINITY_DN1904_c0_g1_i8.p1 TRINITY_DN1904_c0_g1~~TRINITY_DN1904_c0_g1_i8.p1  ORF type:complete len:1294 (+),score=606.18 TRINITY_DN1904_c0_g1_i8:75-3956(+)